MKQILTKVLHSQVKPASATGKPGFDHNADPVHPFLGCASCLIPVLTGTTPAASGEEQKLQEGLSVQPKLAGDAAQSAPSLIIT